MCAAWWFQKGNTIRAEGSVKLDANNTLRGAYTYGTEENTENRTFVNIKERDGFIIEPFTASIATAAVAYTLTRDDYTFDAAYDINRNAAFLSAGKRYNDRTAGKVCTAAFTRHTFTLLPIKPCRSRISIQRRYLLSREACTGLYGIHQGVLKTLGNVFAGFLQLQGRADSGRGCPQA